MTASSRACTVLYFEPQHSSHTVMDVQLLITVAGPLFSAPGALTLLFWRASGQEVKQLTCCSYRMRVQVNWEGTQGYIGSTQHLIRLCLASKRC